MCIHLYTNVSEPSKKTCCLGFLGIILKSYMGIIINYYKEAVVDQPLQWKVTRIFFVAQVAQVD